MASDRAKLVLDEQSFQGLLAAAFTIQEHNARMNAGEAPAADAEAAARSQAAPAKTESNTSQVKPEAKSGAAAAITCKQCGGQLAALDASCPNCNVPNYRPGERLQRNWASLWQMSKEQGLALDARRNLEDDFPLSPGDPGRTHSGAGSPRDTRPIDSSRGTRGIGAGGPAAPLRIQEMNPDAGAEVLPEQSSPESGNADSAQEYLEPEGDWRAETGSETPDDLALASSVESYSVGSDAQGEEAAWDEPEEVAAKGGTLGNLRVKLHFRRADLFLGLAVVVAAVALLWPAAEQKPKLPTWERILIAMGVAEAPQPVVHFHGDPNLKVWVDTHTALYYCPGDELYGKSPDGHYSTQREAQSDRFEPAERSVCIE